MVNLLSPWPDSTAKKRGLVVGLFPPRASALGPFGVRPHLGVRHAGPVARKYPPIRLHMADFDPTNMYLIESVIQQAAGGLQEGPGLRAAGAPGRDSSNQSSKQGRRNSENKMKQAPPCLVLAILIASLPAHACLVLCWGSSWLRLACVCVCVARPGFPSSGPLLCRSRRRSCPWILLFLSRAPHIAPLSRHPFALATSRSLLS
jgi:hypothetical protein